jgi:hypothetical protein
MDQEAILIRICDECAAELPEDAKFCPSCGASAEAGEARSQTESGGATVGEMLADFASGTADEIRRTTAPLLKSETGRKVAAGAAIGAAAAVLVPFVSIGLGAVVGAGIAAFRRQSD